MSVKMRQHVERIIARRVLLDLIAAGYSINIDNGGDTEELSSPSIKIKEILAVMFATDNEDIIVYNGPKFIGWVRLIYGNDGYDTVSDYTVNLEKVLRGANKLADKYA
jgi:hypothetical protein